MDSKDLGRVLAYGRMVTVELSGNRWADAMRIVAEWVEGHPRDLEGIVLLVVLMEAASYASPGADDLMTGLNARVERLAHAAEVDLADLRKQAAALVRAR